MGCQSAEGNIVKNLKLFLVLTLIFWLPACAALDALSWASWVTSVWPAGKRTADPAAESSAGESGEKSGSSGSGGDSSLLITDKLVISA